MQACVTPSLCETKTLCSSPQNLAHISLEDRMNPFDLWGSVNMIYQTVKCILIKFGTHVNHDVRISAIDFQGQRSWSQYTNMEINQTIECIWIKILYCKRGNFRIKVIFVFFALLSSSRKLPQPKNQSHMLL